MTRDEEVRLSRLGLAGDMEARNQVVMGFHHLIRKEANWIAKYTGSTPEDLCHVGIVHVLQRFHRFDPDRGFRAATYFMRHIRSAMFQFAINCDHIVHTPKSAKGDYLGGKYAVQLTQARGKVKDIYERISRDETYADSLYAPIAEESEYDVEAFQKVVKGLKENYRNYIEAKLKGLNNTEYARKIDRTRQNVDVLESRVINQIRKRLNY